MVTASTAYRKTGRLIRRATRPAHYRAGRYRQGQRADILRRRGGHQPGDGVKRQRQAGRQYEVEGQGGANSVPRPALLNGVKAAQGAADGPGR